MGAMNPFEYYTDPLLHGSYKYISLLDLVNNIMDNQTGDDTLLGQVPRRKIIFQVKQAIKKFNIGNLNEPRGCELELNDTLTAIFPPDYVNYIRISYVHPTTGKLMPMTINKDLNVYNAYLQDQDANILFDQDGYILEGSSMNAQLESQQNVISYEFDANCFCNGGSANFGLDVSQNRNGNYNITKDGIHFGSDSLSKVIMLEYISDGLEVNDDKDIRINKLLESAVYAYVKWQILTNKDKVQEYIVKRAEKEFFAIERNATIQLMNIRYEDVMFLLNGRKNWLR
jgi:hypothetical protein